MGVGKNFVRNWPNVLLTLNKWRQFAIYMLMEYALGMSAPGKRKLVQLPASVLYTSSSFVPV